MEEITKIRRRHWKLFNNRSSKIFPTVATSLDLAHNCSKGLFRSIQAWGLQYNHYGNFIIIPRNNNIPTEIGGIQYHEYPLKLDQQPQQTWSRGSPNVCGNISGSAVMRVNT